MKTKTIDYRDDEVVARIDVRRATFLDGFVRDQMVANAIQQPADDDPRTQALRTVAIVIQPAVMAATLDAVIAQDGEYIPWPLSLEDLVSLPPDLINQWMAAIWELNPAWSPGGSETEKKA